MSFSTYPQQIGFGTGVPFFSQQQTPFGLPVSSPQTYWNQVFNPTLVWSELQRLAIHQIALQQLAIQLQQQIQQQLQQQPFGFGYGQPGYGQQQLGGLGNSVGGWPHQMLSSTPQAIQSMGQPQLAGIV